MLLVTDLFSKTGYATKNCKIQNSPSFRPTMHILLSTNGDYQKSVPAAALLYLLDVLMHPRLSMISQRAPRLRQTSSLAHGCQILVRWISKWSG